jgi:hypothetical protein
MLPETPVVVVPLSVELIGPVLIVLDPLTLTVIARGRVIAQVSAGMRLRPLSSNLLVDRPEPNGLGGISLTLFVPPQVPPIGPLKRIPVGSSIWKDTFVSGVTFGLVIVNVTLASPGPIRRLGVKASVTSGGAVDAESTRSVAVTGGVVGPPVMVVDPVVFT